MLCALTFLGIKSFEYRDKFTHYEVLDDKMAPVMIRRDYARKSETDRSSTTRPR